MAEETIEKKMENKMRDIKIEKVVLSIGGVGEGLDKGVKLLERLSGKKAVKKKTRKRIPTLGVRPGLEVGCMVTLRGKKAEDILKKILAAIDNRLKRKQFSSNSLSFGIKEYIEIPGMQYQRDIGIIGFDVSVAFTRAGRRIKERKIKRSKLPAKQQVIVEEIVKFMKDKFNTEVVGR